MLTVGHLAGDCGLSRSTLLYYERIGLLTPSARSAAGYRLYTDADRSRLEKILMYRDLGLPLEAIGQLLESAPGSAAELLERRLERINQEISALRRQQELILPLLQQRDAARRARVMDKAGWVALLRATGLSDDDMDRWHQEFERLAPEAHQDFLESLGIAAEEIATIRKLARAADDDD